MIDKLLRGLLEAFLQQTDLRRLGPRHTYTDISFENKIYLLRLSYFSFIQNSQSEKC